MCLCGQYSAAWVYWTLYARLSMHKSKSVYLVQLLKLLQTSQFFRSYFIFAVLVSDELSLSSGSSSHGMSRTPSPPSSSTYPSFSSSSNPGTSSSTAMLPETYSRKVFVGGLPPDIDQGIQNFTISLLFIQNSFHWLQVFYADRSLFSLFLPPPTLIDAKLFW